MTTCYVQLHPYTQHVLYHGGHVTIESTQHDYERNPCNDWVRCLKSIVECDKRKSIVPKCNTQTPELVLREVCIVDNSHHLWPNDTSHLVVHVS